MKKLILCFLACTTTLAWAGKGWWEKPLLELPFAYGQGSFLSLAEYEELKQLGHLVKSLYPPSEHVWVGIGRGLDQLITYLEQEHADSVRRAPISGMSEIPPGSDIARLFQPHLANYLQATLPSVDALAGRSAVFLDYARTGGTLVNVVGFARQIYGDKGYSKKILGLGLADRPFVQKLDGVRYINGLDYPLILGHAASYRSHAVSKYEGYSITDFWNGKKPVEEPIHDHYVNLLRLRMSHERAGKVPSKRRR